MEKEPLGSFFAYLDQVHNGKGLMTEAMGSAVEFAFNKLNLHRVQAAVMPRNLGSIRVLEKNGFRLEGTVIRYLQINGIWKDHRIYALTQEEWE